MKTVYENNLIRFAAVKRAVATWTGICDLDHVDRISEKMMESIWESMKDYPAKPMEYVKTNDSVLIMCGLWALGFHDVKEAIKVMDGYLENGTKNQLLTMGYYNTMLQYHGYAHVTAAKVVLGHPDDYELIAVFMPSFLNTAEDYAYEAVNSRYGSGDDEKKVYKRIPVEYLFTSREEAYACFDIMRRIYQNIPKKKIEFSPVVFPWYGTHISKTQLIIRMCVTAYALKDEALMDECCGYLSSIDVNENYTNRSIYLEMLTHDLHSETARRTLLEAVADKESYTRQTAFNMVKTLQLRQEEYVELEGFLRFKSADIRKNILTILNAQEVMGRLQSADRLLKAGKAELRMGGLTILQDFHQNEKLLSSDEEKKTYEELLAGLSSLTDVTESEQVIMDELSGNGKASEILNEEGYGLYHPNEMFEMPKREEHPEIFREYFKISKETLDKEFEKLAKFYVEHGMLEYKTAYGETTLLMNGLSNINYRAAVSYPDSFPFKELWIEYYEKELHDVRLLWLMNLASKDVEGSELENRAFYHKTIEKLLGTTLANYKVSLGKNYENQIVRAVCTVVNILACIYKDEKMYEVSKEVLNYAVYQLKDEELWFKTVPSEWQRRSLSGPWKGAVSLFQSSRMSASRSGFSYKNEDEYKEWFAIYYDYDRRFKANEYNQSGYYYSARDNNTLDILDYVKAFTLGIVTENEIYKAAFDYSSLEYTTGRLSMLFLDTLSEYEKRQIAQADDPKVKEKTVEVYHKIINKVLDVELARGDLPTPFSNAAGKVNRIYGIDRMVQILVALGKEKLDRSTYYYGSNGDSKKVVLSHLLSACYPNAEDTAENVDIT